MVHLFAFLLYVFLHSTVRVYLGDKQILIKHIYVYIEEQYHYEYLGDNIGCGLVPWQQKGYNFYDYVSVEGARFVEDCFAPCDEDSNCKAIVFQTLYDGSSTMCRLYPFSCDAPVLIMYDPHPLAGKWINKTFFKIIDIYLRPFVTDMDYSQGGFRKGFQCADNVFAVRKALQAAKGQKRKIFLSFLDAKLAFDTIDRNFIWWALDKLGVDTLII